MFGFWNKSKAVGDKELDDDSNGKVDATDSSALQPLDIDADQSRSKKNSELETIEIAEDKMAERNSPNVSHEAILQQMKSDHEQEIKDLHESYLEQIGRLRQDLNREREKNDEQSNSVSGKAMKRLQSEFNNQKSKIAALCAISTRIASENQYKLTVDTSSL